MQSENPLIADIVKMMNSAAGTMAGMTREAGGAARERAKEFLGGLDFVSREEFETMKDIAVKTLAVVEALKQRVDAMEAGANAAPAASPPAGSFPAGDADPTL